jgi:hypothetical protein|tara:strand:+ start:182 stop:1240 length:1059 start_codon:yes stop_codon:yes gene_type:complete
MNVTDKLYTEWAWRTETGTPDINNPRDKAILDKLIRELSEEAKPVTKDDIVALLSSIENDSEAMQYIKKYISNRPNQNSFFTHINSKNIDSKTLESGDAPQRVFNVLSNNDQLNDYMEYVKKPISFAQLGSSGNLVTALQNELTADTIQLLINIGGQEGGRGVGKAEIGLAALVGDVKMMKGGKGDLDWSGKYLEVKGTAARLGKRDHSFTGGAKILDTAEEIAGDTTRPDKFMPAILRNSPDKFKESVNDLKDLLSQVYESGAVKQYITDESCSDSNLLRIALQKVYAASYSKREGVDHFIFVDTSTNYGNFLSVTPEQLLDYIDANPKTFSSPVNLKNGLAPQVFRGGIK